MAVLAGSVSSAAIDQILGDWQSCYPCVRCYRTRDEIEDRLTKANFAHSNFPIGSCVRFALGRGSSINSLCYRGWMCPIVNANRCPFLLPPIVRNMGGMSADIWMRRWNGLVPLPYDVVIVDTVESQNT